jgi:ubiquitin-conjugating enzyme E2 D/E
MTPETSDDEDDGLLHLPDAAHESWDGESEDRPAATSEQSSDESRDLLLTSVPTIGGRDGDGEHLQHLPVAAPERFRAEYQDPFASPTASPESSDDEDEDYFETLLPQPYYGSLLSSIRAADKAILERADPAAAEGHPRWIVRVHRELKAIHEDDTVPYLSVAPIDGNLRNCLASMEGAPETPYEGGIFWLHIDFPEDYPLKPPIVTFLTPVYHPNIDQHGRICIDILETSWSPCLQTQHILLSILSVLHNPILDSDEALVPEIAEKYSTDHRDFCDIVRIYTASASASRPDTSNLINSTPARSS